MSAVSVVEAWVPIRLPEFVRLPGTATKSENAAAWKAHVALWRCRDCGIKTKLNQGGGTYLLCDDCAPVDGCEEWTHAGHLPDGKHHTMWGTLPHAPAEHELLIAARLRRRASYWKAATS